MLKVRFGNAGYFILIIIVTSLNVLLFDGCNKNDNSSNPVSGGTAAKNEVLIQGMAFASGSRTVSVGTTLKWTNQDAVSHTVTSGTPGSPSGVFDSGKIAPQGSFSFTFNQKGTFRYYCSIHASMTAVITVQ